MNAKRCARGLTGSVGIIGVLCLAGCGPWPQLFQKEEKLMVDPARAYIDAQATLLQAAEDKDPVTRANAMEALAGTLGAEAGAVFVQALDEQNPLVRFAAAMAIGDSKYKPALDRLLTMARDKKGEPDKRVFCAVIYALHVLGNDEYAGQLGDLLFDSEREVRMDAAMAMGRMGEPTATGPLKTVLSGEQDEGVRLQIRESLARLGDEGSAQVMEAYTKGFYLDLRLAAIPALADIGTRRAAIALRSLTDERHPARIRVLAAGELARLGQGDPADYDLCMAALRNPKKVLDESNLRTKRLVDSDVDSLRRLAAIAVGWMGRDLAVNVLHPMLKSARGGDRVAAALSILRLLKAYRPMAPAARKPVVLPTTAPAGAKPTTAPAKPAPTQSGCHGMATASPATAGPTSRARTTPAAIPARPPATPTPVASR